MRILRALVAVIVMLVCFAGIASAQDSLIGTLSKKDSSVYKVMRTAGCDMRWLSQAISDSRIDPARVRRLPVGQKIYLKGNVCKSNPSVQVAKASNDILKSDRPQPKVVQAETALAQNPSNQAEVSKIREESATVTKQFTNATAEIAKLNLRAKSLEIGLTQAKSEVAKLKQELAQNIGKRPIVIDGKAGLNLFLAGLIGLLAGVAIWYRPAWLERMLGTEMIHVRRTRTIYGEDGRWDFVICGGSVIKETGKFEPEFKCPRCSEKNLLGYDRCFRDHMKAKVLGHVRHRTIIDVDPKLLKESSATVQRLFG